MKIYNVVGKNKFTSNKTGKQCHIIYTTFEVENAGSGMQGRQCKEYFVPSDAFDSVEVGDDINIFFNDNKYVEEVRVVD